MRLTRTPVVLFVAIAAMTTAIGCGAPSVVLRDAGGNAYALKDMPDGRTWTIDNLRLAHAGSYCYNDSTSNCFQHGRLYTWAAAVDVCRQLGPGWQLPTDDEWRQLARNVGGVRGDAADEGQAAFVALMTGGASGFNGVFGGNRDPNGAFARLDEHGLYWTATQSDAEHAWFYNFGRGGRMVSRHGQGNKAMALAVRCIAAR